MLNAGMLKIWRVNITDKKQHREKILQQQQYIASHEHKNKHIYKLPPRHTLPVSNNSPSRILPHITTNTPFRNR